jgi:hypothetical protein
LKADVQGVVLLVIPAVGCELRAGQKIIELRSGDTKTFELECVFNDLQLQLGLVISQSNHQALLVHCVFGEQTNGGRVKHD